MRTKMCEICGDTFVMGQTGTTDGCDSCTGVIRDTHGYASIAFNLVNNHLREVFGPNVVKLVPDTSNEYDYFLRFADGIELTDKLINNAKEIVGLYDGTQWFDDEMREVDEW